MYVLMYNFIVFINIHIMYFSEKELAKIQKSAETQKALGKR